MENVSNQTTIDIDHKTHRVVERKFTPDGEEIFADRQAVYEFSIGTRLTHWLRALCIAFLIYSGFYLAYGFITHTPSDEPVNFLQAWWRSWHQIVGFVLIACMVFKFYLFFFDKMSHNERRSAKDIFSINRWVRQILYYLRLDDHPHLTGVYNPLQFVSYVLFYIALFVISLTGLVLYAHVYHDGLGGAIYPLMRWCEVAIFGNLANVRIVHHVAMWVIIIFTVAHVYMAIFNAVKGKDGAIDAIVSGHKFVKDGVRT